MEKIPAAPSGSASLEKGLVLFDRIVQDHGRTPLRELARDMGLPRSTLHRLISALERQGLVTRIGRGHMDVGLPLIQSLQGVSVVERLRRISRPLLRRLARDCGATAHLGVLENDMVTYLVKVQAGAAKAVASFTQENGQLEAYCSGIGKVLLSHLSEAERRTYLASGPFVPLTARTITDPQVLDGALSAVRTAQFARDDGEIADDLYCLAVPLRNSRQEAIAAISLSFVRSGHAQNQDHGALSKLQICAEAIRTKLGFKPPAPQPIEPFEGAQRPRQEWWA